MELATLPERMLSRPWSDDEDEGLSVGTLLKAFRRQLGLGDDDDDRAGPAVIPASSFAEGVRATEEDLAHHASAEQGLRQRLAAGHAHGMAANLMEDDMAMAGVALRVAVRETPDDGGAG